MAIKLIAIDLDDTLLDNRQQLSPRTLAVLRAMPTAAVVQNRTDLGSA